MVFSGHDYSLLEPKRCFRQVVGSPKGLKVGLVEALALLLRVGEVEAGAWLDMVDVPQALVGPGHARLKLAFQMGHEMLDRDAD